MGNSSTISFNLAAACSCPSISDIPAFIVDQLSDIVERVSSPKKSKIILNYLLEINYHLQQLIVVVVNQIN
jgi:hypothetical protein